MSAWHDEFGVPPQPPLVDAGSPDVRRVNGRINMVEASVSALRKENEELRSRLQALEQNTVPAGSVKQKPREWWAFRPNAYCDFCISPSKPHAYHELVRVREVLDD